MSSRSSFRGLTLDTGALIGLERGDQVVRAAVRSAAQHHREIAVPAGVLAQYWRAGGRQAQVARLIAQSEVSVIPLDEPTAKAIGVLCGISGHADIIDVHVALHATEHGHHVVTSDPGDLRAVNSALQLIEV